MSDDPKTRKEIDSLSGVETTGHEWDGLKELNNPAPRWWLWVFYVTVIWSIGYYVFYPAWPTWRGATQGALGYSQQKELRAGQAEIVARQASYRARFEKASFSEILEAPDLYAFAQAGGAAAFKDNCATCHGAGGGGARGYPNLNDDDWLWGGTLDEIYTTLLHGIRSAHEEARFSQMPAFGRDGLLKTEEIRAVAAYVRGLSGGSGTVAADPRGAEIFATQCVSCHGADGRGNRDFGAPNLADKIWLYGGSPEAVYQSIYNARAGVMPAWDGRLDRQTIRQLAVYVHQLGGGEEEKGTADLSGASVPALSTHE